VDHKLSRRDVIAASLALGAARPACPMAQAQQMPLANRERIRPRA